MYHHPKYYAALRAERRKLQASSPKPQADESSKLQASSPKQQASSSEGSSEDLRSFKPQASSSMIREPRNI